MKSLIYTDTGRLKLQIAYNESYAKNVNEVIAALGQACGKLSDEQLRGFLANPAKLADELTKVAREEYTDQRWMVFNLSPIELWIGEEKYADFKPMVLHFESV